MPLSIPPPAALYAPTAMSLTPSPSRSPMLVTDLPKLSLSFSTGPLVVLSLISTVLFGVPLLFSSMMCIAPLLVPPSSSENAQLAHPYCNSTIKH